jgi:hypothetical protein
MKHFLDNLGVGQTNRQKKVFQKKNSKDIPKPPPALLLPCFCFAASAFAPKKHVGFQRKKKGKKKEKKKGTENLSQPAGTNTRKLTF